MPSTVSPLRYPGGKSKLYPYVREILSCNNMLGETYIEPFAGGAGLALKLLISGDVSRIIINDFDPSIYAFWYSVLNETDHFCELVENAVLNQGEWERQRNIYHQLDIHHPLELGFATFYLNRTNISGVVKGGMIGGRAQNGRYGLAARFNRNTLIQKINNIALHKEQIILLNQDAKCLLRPHELRKYYKTFINLDPPYVKKGAQLYKNAFSESDHKELCNLIKNCSRKWIVTYDICPLVAELYKSYRSSYIDVTYSVQASKKAREYIFFSNNLNLPQEIKLRSSEE